VSNLNPSYDLSVIVPVGGRVTDTESLYRGYRDALAGAGHRVEFIYVLDGPNPTVAAALERLTSAGEPITRVSLTRQFGEATAVSAGFEYAHAPIVLTLPAYAQVEAVDLPKLVDALKDTDLVVARRWPRVGGPLERARRALFHGLLARVTRQTFHDLGCAVRAMRRRVLEEIPVYGDQQRFLPVLADRQGFKVREVDLRQSAADRFEGVYGPREYTRGFLDIFTVFFLVRFTKRPLRFFGMIGVVTFLLGTLALLYMSVEKFVADRPMADRPALLAGTLLMVLGLQIFALGLLGELIIFVHAGSTKDYQVDKVIQFGTGASQDA